MLLKEGVTMYGNGNILHLIFRCYIPRCLNHCNGLFGGGGGGGAGAPILESSRALPLD